MSHAYQQMQEFNPNALVGRDGNVEIMIEDVSDPDGRLYRMEYQSTEDGRHAIAFCRYNPWGSPDGGESPLRGHCFEDGLLCMGTRHPRSPRESSDTLAAVIQRARYWCTAFSVLKETGNFPQP